MYLYQSRRHHQITYNFHFWNNGYNFLWRISRFSPSSLIEPIIKYTDTLLTRLLRTVVLYELIREKRINIGNVRAWSAKKLNQSYKLFEKIFFGRFFRRIRFLWYLRYWADFISFPKTFIEKSIESSLNNQKSFEWSIKWKLISIIIIK